MRPPQSYEYYRMPIEPLIRAPAPSPPRNLRSLAAIAVEGGSTRYDLPLARHAIPSSKEQRRW